MYSPSYYASIHNIFITLANIKIRIILRMEGSMTHDFNKPPHVISATEKTQKKRVPVYILILVGIFLIAVLAYMFADTTPNPSDAPPGHPNPSAQPATPNNTTTGTSGDQVVSTDSNTATAKDN